MAGFGLLVKDFGNPPILDANMGDALGAAGTVKVAAADNKRIELVHRASLLFVFMCRQSSQPNVICPLILAGGPCNAGH